MDSLKREDIEESIAIIKVNKSYRDGMSALELYDVTRGCWKRKIESVEKADYVLSVVFGEIKEVYKVERWVSADKLNRETLPYNPQTDAGRIGFFGDVADDIIRSKYIGKNVGGLFKHGEADPVKVLLGQAVKITKPSDINQAARPVLIIEADEYP